MMEGQYNNLKSGTMASSLRNTQEGEQERKYEKVGSLDEFESRSNENDELWQAALEVIKYQRR